MTAADASKGLRKFLRGHGGEEIDFAWLQRSGEEGKEALFRALALKSTSKKSKMAIKGLLVAFFFSPEVEQRLLAYVRSHPDPRVQKIDEQVLRYHIDHRDETKASLMQTKKTPNPEGSVERSRHRTLDEQARHE